MTNDVSHDIYVSARQIENTAASAELAIEGAMRSDVAPDLRPVLQELVDQVGFLVNVYAPSEDATEPQPVEFVEPGTGWDFDAWMWDKTSTMKESAGYALETWDRLAAGFARNAFTWKDAAGPFGEEDLGDTPVNNRQYLEFCLSGIRARAGAICEMVSTRLTARAPGKPGAAGPIE